MLSLSPTTAGAVAKSADLGPVMAGFRESFKRMSSGVNLGTVLLFTGQLAAMLGGGLHLVRILTALAAESTHKVFSRILERVRDDITAGSTFADSLAQHPARVQPALHLHRAGGGSLRLAPRGPRHPHHYLEKTDAIRRKVKGAIAYPAVILTVAILIVMFMIIKIVPIFESVYAKANAQLPLPTRVLILISSTIRSYLLVVILGVLLLGVLLYALSQTPAGRRFFDTLKLRMPLFGSLIRKSIMARTCRTLSVLLNAGIPLIEAMETVSKVSGNSVIESAMADATQRMRDGGTIAETLRETGHFPGMITQLVATGEESGTLPTMLAQGRDLLRAAGRPGGGDAVVAHRARHDRGDGRHRRRGDLRPVPAHLQHRAGDEGRPPVAGADRHGPVAE